MNEVKLSLCIPTNGVSEWVFPVLDSIYDQKVDESLYEVIVTDNGDNLSFKEKIRDYEKRVSNLVYKETDAQGFTNQIKAFELATGEFIKFVNHRMPLMQGSLEYFINFVAQYKLTKPYVYFSNGALSFKGERNYARFNEFANDLSYYLSWSAGIGLWREDFESVKLEKNYSDLFPHFNFIFPYVDKNSYIIDNKLHLDTLPTDVSKKGRYNFFSAFGIEFIDQMKYLLEKNNITKDTFDHILKDNGDFLSKNYAMYILDKQPCSYDFSDAEKYLDKYYDFNKIKHQAYKHFVNLQWVKVKSKIKR